MTDYTGSRRAAPALSVPSAPVDRDVAATSAGSCPECGALVRPEQRWCTLCLHVLGAPEPDPAPVAAPQPVLVTTPPATAPAPDSSTVLAPEVEAAAEALLEQLAQESRREGLTLPSWLQSKGQKALAVAVAMSLLSTVVLLVMTVLGAFLH